MGNRQSTPQQQSADERQEDQTSTVFVPPSPDEAAEALGHPDLQQGQGKRSFFHNIFHRITGVFSSRSKEESVRRNQSFGGFRERGRRRGRGRRSSEGQDSTRSRSPIAPRIPIRTGKTLEEAKIPPSPKEDRRNGIEMSNLESDLEVGIEAQNFIASGSEPDLSGLGIREVEQIKYPFLDDSVSVEWIRRNNVLFVMRGLPGSGKSTLAQRIMQEYKCTVKCSADDYFTTERGEYVYDATRLKDAHEECQKKCSEAVNNHHRIIIVDNTNVTYWDMKFYFELAKKNQYYVILAEPKTSWRLDPKILAQRNCHGVTASHLSKRVKEYKHIFPRYYGWFMCPKKSQALINYSTDLFKILITNCPEFKAFFSAEEEFEEDLPNYFSRDLCTDKQGLHCTARFIQRKGKKFISPPNPAYATRLSEALGKASCLQITGFVFTAGTFGAKVELTSEQLKIYDNDHKELAESAAADVTPSRRRRGVGAHLTLGTAKGIKPAETGRDITKAAAALVIKSENMFQVKFEDGFLSKVVGCKSETMSDKKGASASSCGGGSNGAFTAWTFQLKTALSFDTLFTGVY